MKNKDENYKVFLDGKCIGICHGVTNLLYKMGGLTDLSSAEIRRAAFVARKGGFPRLGKFNIKIED